MPNLNAKKYGEFEKYSTLVKARINIGQHELSPVDHYMLKYMKRKKSSKIISIAMLSGVCFSLIYKEKQAINSIFHRN